MSQRIIVVGGGLAGLSAACEMLERGCIVTIVEKQEFLGGNSSKATCGIAAPGLTLGSVEGERDSVEDLVDGQSSGVKRWLQGGSKDVEWLAKNLGIESELVLRLAPGHSGVARVMSSKHHFPGAVVTYAAVRVLHQIASAKPDRISIITSATVTKLVTNGNKVVGVEYSSPSGTTSLKGAVIIASGGFAGDISQSSVLATNAQHLMGLPTTNDARSSGDALKICAEVGAHVEKLSEVEVTPMATDVPGQEAGSFKLVVSEAICGAGGKLLDAHGRRFVDELAPSHARVQAMEGHQGPFRLVIREGDAASVQWFIDFYMQRKVMKRYGSAEVLARELNVPSLDTSIGRGALYVVVVTPALHSCVGGLSTGFTSKHEGSVLNSAHKPIEGLFAAGEAASASFPMSLWCVSGIPLLYAISSGRMAGRAAAGTGKQISDLRELIISTISAPEKTIAGQPPAMHLEELSKHQLIARIRVPRPGGALVDRDPPASAVVVLTMAEVAKHNTESDCWIVVNGRAYDVTRWLQLHPGGAQTITMYAGQDSTDEWNCIHKLGTMAKYLYPKNPNGAIDMGPVSGAAPVVASAAAAPVDKEAPPPEGNGGICGPIGALIFLTTSLVKMVLKTVLCTGNIKIDNSRTGMIRSACFLLVFVVVHSIQHFAGMLKGPMEVNGEGYFFDRIAWTGGLGIFDKSPLSILEVYLALAFLLHVLVALKRSWDISLSYCLYTGRWNMLLSGLVLLGFVIMHLVDIRFSTKVKYTKLRPPAGYLSWDGLREGRVFFETSESVPEVLVRDLYMREVELLKDLGTCLLYTACIIVFWLHMVIGWKKLVPADAMQIPRGHVRSVTWLGWIAASALAGMYLAVVWHTYAAPAIEHEKVA